MRKIVTPSEMKRIEEKAIQSGFSEESFVIQAGRSIAQEAVHWIQSKSKKVILLAGKGHKAADAFASGYELIDRGYYVIAYHSSPLKECRPLCQKMAERFQKKGGRCIQIEHESLISFDESSLVIDGLLGIGYEGPVTGVYQNMIERANGSGLPILAIDIPSGLNAATGQTSGSVIEANCTVSMGLPKVGCFIGDGWNHVGVLRFVDFGLPQESVDSAREVAFLPDWEDVRHWLPKPKRNQHKYQRGCVVGFAGSSLFSGAAKLSSWAALRGGAGIVKLFYPPSADAQMVDTPFEIIRMPWNDGAWTQALEHAKSVFIGPGIGRSFEMKQWVERIVPQIHLPLVLDADALISSLHFPPHSICTPHRQEMLQLLQVQEMDNERLLQECQRFCNEKQCVLVLKGGPTWVFVPSSSPSVIAHGDPGMATAGSGDVLTGLLAALLAQGCSLQQASILGCMIHALAGEKAAQQTSSYCLVARDIIDSLPDVFKQI